MPKIDNVDINCSACLDGGFGPQKMVLRSNGFTAELFLGCRRWPDCRHTQRLPEWLRMKQAGFAELPGFEAGA